MLLPELPEDVLLGLPVFLASVDDLFHLSITCKTLYHVFHDAQYEIKITPGLHNVKTRQSRLRIAYTATQVRDWAIQSRESWKQLVGWTNDGLDPNKSNDLFSRVVRVSMKSMRDMHRIDQKIFAPLVKLVMFNKQVGIDDIDAAERAILKIWTYGELFLPIVQATYVDRELPMTFCEAEEARVNFLFRDLPHSRTVEDREYDGVYEVGKVNFLLEDYQRFPPFSFAAIHDKIGPYSIHGLDEDHFDRVLMASGLLTLRFVLATTPSERLIAAGIEPYRDDALAGDVERVRDSIVAYRRSGKPPLPSPCGHQWRGLEYQHLYVRDGEHREPRSVAVTTYNRDSCKVSVITGLR